MRLLLEIGMLGIMIAVALAQSPPPKDSDAVYLKEQKLYDALFANYSKLFRPSQKTVVQFALSLATILEINEKEGHLTTTFIPKLAWIDTRLSWSPSDYDGIKHMQIPSSHIWLPDVEVLNRYRDSVHDAAMQPLIWLHSDGTIYYVPRQTYQTPCSFNLEKFPFDTQHCQVVLGSWAYLQNEVDFEIMNNGTDETFYVGHTDWHLTALNMERVHTHFAANEVPFVEMIVTISLERRSKFFYYMFMLPANIILMAVPIIHFLPPNKDAKIYLTGSLMVATIIMLNSLEDFMPGFYAPRPPNALKLYTTALFTLVISAVITAVTMNCSNVTTKTKRVPLFLQRVVLQKAAKICCVWSDSQKVDYQLLHLEKSLLDRNESLTNDDRELIVRDEEGTSQEPEESRNSTVNAIQLLVSEMQLARYREQLNREWIQLAQVIDRIATLFFIVFNLIELAVSHSS